MNLRKSYCLLLSVLFLAGLTAEAQTVDIYGQVRIYDGNPSVGVGINGVTVHLYDTMHTVEYTDITHTDMEFMIQHSLTSPDGIYYFDDVPYRLDYWVEIEIPDGYVRATNPEAGSWWNANPRELGDDFYNCFLLLPSVPRTIGFWKHQAKGNGSTQYTYDEFAALLVAVYDRYNSGEYFPVENVTCVNGNPLTPEDALDTFGASNGGPSGMINKAKKQLLALLLNTVAEYVSVYQAISEDDQLISEAIAFGADMIPDGDEIGTAKDAMDYINNGMMVPAGWIPDGYEGIIYSDSDNQAFGHESVVVSAMTLEHYPNPFNPDVTIAFVLPDAATIRLAVYNFAGQKVADLLTGDFSAGQYRVHWSAENQPSGLYIYRLTSDHGTVSGKMLLLK